MSSIYVNGQSRHLINTNGNIQLISIYKSHQTESSPDIPCEIYRIDDDYFKTIYRDHDVLRFLMKNDVKIDAITERELFKHTFSTIYPVRYRLVDHTIHTVQPVKTDPSDAGFAICMSHLKNNTNGVYTYGTNLLFDIKIGYCIEVHPMNTLVHHGFVLANGVKTIEQSECNDSEILVDFIKFNKKSQELPLNTPLCKVFLKKVVYCLSPKETQSFD